MFTAHTASLDEDEFCWTIGLTDVAMDPAQYFLIQGSKNEPEELYFELDDQGRGWYGGVDEIRLSSTSLCVLVAEQTEQVWGIPQEVEIRLMLPAGDRSALRRWLLERVAPLVALREI